MKVNAMGLGLNVSNIENTAFKKYVDNLEGLAQQEHKVAIKYEKYMEKLTKIRGARAELTTRAEKVYSKIREEQLPENISEKVVAASKTFIKQYANQNKRSIVIESILQNISIFIK